MELARLRGVATRVTFPIVDADGDPVTGAAALDSEFTSWADGSNPGAFADLTNEATEIGTTGIYYLILTAGEMGADYIYIRVQTSTAGAKTQHILINTLQARGDASGRTDLGLWIGVAPLALTSQLVQAQANQLGAQARADVNAEVDTGLADVNLDHLVGTAVGIPAIPAGTFLDQIMDDGTAVFDRTTDSLQAIRDTAPLGTAMRGTDSAALASVATEARLAELDAANIPADVDAILNDTGTAGVVVASINTDAIDAVSLATTATAEIADAILNRNIAGGSDGGRDVTSAFRFLRNRWAIAAGTLTVYREDDLTSAWTAAVTTAAGDPVTEVDPA